MSVSVVDAYGAGLQWALSGRRRSSSWYVRSFDGRCTLLPVERWCASPDTVDRQLLARCRGATLDVGCGPGRFVVNLARRGIPALGVDIAAAAVSLARSKGAAVLHRSVFDRLPGEGRWRTVLLVDGNVGIGGDPVRLLTRCRQLLDPDGTVLVELDRPGRGSRQVVLRLETEHTVSDWFPWAHVDPAGLDDVALAAGLSVGETWAGGERWFATLTHR